MKKNMLLMIFILLIVITVAFFVFTLEKEKDLPNTVWIEEENTRPAEMFSTIIKDVNTNNNVDLNFNNVTTCKDLFLYNDLVSPIDEQGNFVYDEKIPAATKEIRVKFPKDGEAEGKMIFFGARNNTDKPISFNDAELTYLSILGFKEYNIFGISFDMNEEMLVKTFGEPQDLLDDGTERFLTYIFNKNNIKYSILITYLNSNPEIIKRIEVAIGDETFH